MAEALRAYGWMKRGFLPAPGGFLDQSRTFVVAAEWIERIEAFHERRRLEKVRRENPS